MAKGGRENKSKKDVNNTNDNNDNDDKDLTADNVVYNNDDHDDKQRLKSSSKQLIDQSNSGNNSDNSNKDDDSNGKDDNDSISNHKDNNSKDINSNVENDNVNHDNNIQVDEKHTEIQNELIKVNKEKSKLEGQYRNLLGKLSSMRDTLGEKLKEDAEELDRRELQIQSLNQSSEEQNKKLNDLQYELQQSEERNSSLSDELSNLRARISTSEKASTDESNQLQIRLRELEHLVDSIKLDKESWQSQADEERLRSESAIETNKNLTNEMDELKNKNENLEKNLDESNKSLINVESLLNESQLIKQREIDETKTLYETQLKELKENAELYRRQSKDAQAELELYRQNAERTPELEQECKEKTLIIGKIRHEAVILNEHLTEALKRIKEFNTSDSVDRQLISNILLSFVSTPRSDSKRFEMLSLLASILGWNQFEREQAGIAPKSNSSKYPTPSSPGSPSTSYFRRSSSRTRPNVSKLTNDDNNASFGQLFVEFLLKETQGNSSNDNYNSDTVWQTPRSPDSLQPNLNNNNNNNNNISSIPSSPNLNVPQPSEENNSS